MKRGAVLFLFALSVLQLFADKDVKFFMNSGEVKCIAQERVDSIVFDDAEEYAIVAFDGLTEQLELASIDSIKYGQLPQEVSVTYAGNSATVINPFAFDSVRVRITGAKVVVTSLTTREIDYSLQGASDDGCFKIYGSRKYNLYLNGLELTNSCGAAINSQCKKRARVFVNEGTDNLLADAAQIHPLWARTRKVHSSARGR